MAQIFPIKEDTDEMPYSEKKVYDFLSNLSNKFTIFHSVQWIKRGNKWKSTWKENDFLLFNRQLGALVLEVKGGNIECHGSVFHQINTRTGEVNVLSEDRKKDPLSQAIDGIYHYRDVLDKISKDLSDRFPIEAAVWFSTCNVKDKINSFPLKYREASGAVLGNEDFERKDKAIYDVFDFYSSHAKVNITDAEYDKIINAIASDFELISAPQNKKSELEYAFLKLTKEQMGLLDYISEQKNATIQGVAGTGKTLIAKEAARRFGLEGRKVLFLCFNRFLFIHLKKMYPYDNVEYFNIHTFVAQYRPRADTSSTKKRQEELQRIDWNQLDYDDIIIDEAQDFTNEEVIYLKEYVELKDGHFFAFYDKNQLLTTKKVPEWIEQSECKLLLTQNCRNTYEIAKTSYNIIDIEIDKKVMMVNGDKTSISFTNQNPLNGIRKIIKTLTSDQYGFSFSDIVILSLKSETHSVLNGVNNIQGIPITREKTNTSVFFTTASKFKGLESNVIIIIDIDETSFNNEEKKRIFYVACSRAMQKLCLYIVGDKLKLKQISQAINDKSPFAPKGIIAMKTQANVFVVE